MTDREKLNLLIEAIDYSFWNPIEKDYNKELTYPVIDRVKYIKKIMQEESAPLTKENSTPLSGGERADSKQEEPLSDKAEKAIDEFSTKAANGLMEQLKENLQTDALSQFEKDFEEIVAPYKGSHNYKNLCVRLIVWQQNLWRWMLSKQKEEPVSEDLSSEIDYLSKRYPEVSFAKLSRIAVHVANWQKEQMIKDAIKSTNRTEVIEYIIPLYDDICMAVYEVEYVYKWGDGYSSQTLMRSYGVYERKEVAEYVAQCIDDGRITV